MTTLTILLASSKVVMQKEEEAFSFECLVADVGGVLGLFIGFNFLMTLETLVSWIGKVPCNLINEKINPIK